MDVVKPDVSLDVFGELDGIACITNRLMKKIRNQDFQSFRSVVRGRT